MDLQTDRREFLSLAGAGLSLSMAGCSAPEPGAGTADVNDGPTERATVTVALEIDQEAFATAREELVQRIENGSINQSQAQSELLQTEAELLSEAADTFATHASDTELTVEKRAESVGVLLVSGPPAALIDAIGRSEVRGLFSEATYQQALEQQDGA